MTTPKRTRLDRTERQVTRAVDRLGGVGTHRGWHRADWTRAVKREVARLGKRNGHYVCAASVNEAHWGEWLYDVCWLHMDRGDFLGRVPLVMECEWQANEVENDFLKLVQARADHRVMVFYPYAGRTAITSAHELMENAQRFRHSDPGDRYLFGYWNDDRLRLEWVAYVL